MLESPVPSILSLLEQLGYKPSTSLGGFGVEPAAPTRPPNPPTAESPTMKCPKCGYCVEVPSISGQIVGASLGMLSGLASGWIGNSGLSTFTIPCPKCGYCSRCGRANA